MFNNILLITQKFQLYGELTGAELFSSGHIHDTYVATYNQGGTPVKYVIQRINNHVFKEPAKLMHNMVRILEHIRVKLISSDESDFSRKVLSLIPTRDGQQYYNDGAENFWRVFVYIERARTFDIIETEEMAFEAAKAFGHFQKLLVDLPKPRLHETIPDFHNTPKRFATLLSAVENDVCDRAKSVKKEIEFCLKHKAVTEVLLNLHAKGDIPERVTHNDTKINNVMLDNNTGKGVCVLDLDTVMPGLTLYDFGDMMRTATNPAQEDEADLSKVNMQMPMFEAIARGFLESTSDMLNKSEKEHLAFGGILITLEVGIRFLTDHLLGDTYFKIHRRNQNLDRARAQFKLVESMESQRDAMNAFIQKII